MKFLKTKKFIVCIFLGGLFVSMFYLWRFFNQFDLVTQDKEIFYSNIFLLSLVVMLQMMGHYLRAHKFSLLLNPVRKTNDAFLFQSLGVGFLFNALFPFRLGELVRAYIIGKHLHISRTVVFFIILFERVLDVFIVFLGVFVVLFFVGDVSVMRHLFSALFPFFIFMIGISILVMILMYELYVQNRYFLIFFHIMTSFLNDKLKNKTRFIIWSIIFGITTIYKKANIEKYIRLSILMWLFYVGSIALLVNIFFKNRDFFRDILISLTAYLSVSIPSGPAYIGTYHYYFTNIVTDIFPQSEGVTFFSLISWGILIVPISLIGVIFLYRDSLNKYKLFDFLTQKERNDEEKDFRNKLFRYDDISNEMSYFLDAYFKGFEIARIINFQEISGKVKLIKTFKGGSNASTGLIWNGNLECIRKTTLLQHAEKLEDQYNWIKERQHLKNIPNVIGFVRDDISYSIDIEYKREFMPFFDFIHSRDVELSKRILEDVIIFANRELYADEKIIESHEEIEYYIKTKIYDKVNDCLVLNEQLGEIMEYPEIEINGKKYDNFLVMMEKILGNERIMSAISRYHKTSVLHGDLTVDNIIVNGNEFMVLDPNNENYISDPLVDYAKLYQSLHSGYEFLCMLRVANTKSGSIFFEENSSSRYYELFLHLECILSGKLDEDRMILIKLHEAIHYFRMLTYRAKINPLTFMAFYGIAVRLLNEFYNDFNSKKNVL